MQVSELIALVEALAPTLRALDATLADSQPGCASTGPQYPDLDGACSDLVSSAQAVADALGALGGCTQGGQPLSDFDIARLGGGVAHSADGLRTCYHRVAALSLRSDRSAVHERLAETARDHLVTLAHALASIIDHGVALALGAAATGASGEHEVGLSFNSPDNGQQLQAWTPVRLAYASHATASALDKAKRCRTELARITGTSALQASVSLPPAAPVVLGFGSKLVAVALGLAVGLELFDDDCS